MPSNLCFQFHPRWNDILPQLTLAIKNNDTATVDRLTAILEARDRDQEEKMNELCNAGSGTGVVAVERLVNLTANPTVINAGITRNFTTPSTVWDPPAGWTNILVMTDFSFMSDVNGIIGVQSKLRRTSAVGAAEGHIAWHYRSGTAYTQFSSFSLHNQAIFARKDPFDPQLRVNNFGTASIEVHWISFIFVMANSGGFFLPRPF